MVSLAGAAAVRELTGVRKPKGCEADCTAAIDIAERLSGSSEETSAYVDWLAVRTKQIVSLHRREVERVAKALCKERTLSGHLRPYGFDVAALTVDAIGRVLRGEHGGESERALERVAADVIEADARVEAILRAGVMAMRHPTKSVANAAAVARASYETLTERAAIDDDAFVLTALCHASVVHDDREFEVLVMAAPYFLRATYEQLYLPRAAVDILGKAWRRWANRQGNTG